MPLILVGLLALAIFLIAYWTIYTTTTTVTNWSSLFIYDIHALYLEVDSHLIELNSKSSTNNELDFVVKAPNDCACHRDTHIRLTQWPELGLYGVYEVDTARNVSQYLYNLTYAELHETTSVPCNLYAMLRRGKGQYVVSYSLFGQKMFYYRKLNVLSEQIAKMYPGWIMRVYHDR